MRANIRPFLREIKSRSFKKTIRPMEAQSAESPGSAGLPTAKQEKRSLAELTGRRIDAAQREAEAVFRQDVPASKREGDEQTAPLITGRILPCLLQESSDSASTKTGGVDDIYRGKGPRGTTGRARLQAKASSGMHSTINSKARSTTLWRESVNEEFAKLSDLEILSLIERAKAEVVRRRESGKEQLRAEIEAKLKSAGLDIGDLFESEGKRTRGSNKAKSEEGQSTVAAKYKNHVTGEAWSGRGRSPKWVTSVMQEREWTVEEFKQSDEFLIA